MLLLEAIIDNIALYLLLPLSILRSNSTRRSRFPIKDANVADVFSGHIILPELVTESINVKQTVTIFK